MSWQATSWVIERSKHKGSALLTLLCIANCANGNGTHARPGMSRLAKDTRMSRRQVVRIVEKLEASGEIAIRKSEGVENSYSLPLMVGTGDKMTRVENATTRDTIMSPTRDIAMSPIPKDSQEEEKKRVPLPQKTSYRDPVLPAVEISPHQELIAFVQSQNGDLPFPGKEAKAVKWLLERYSAEQCKKCFLCLTAEPWRTAAVTWKTVQGQIGVWVKKGEPNTYASSNGANGNRPAEAETPSWMHAPKQL